MEDEDTYMVVRFFDGGLTRRKTVKTGLTRAQAVEHCSDPDSEGMSDDGIKWFDGFEKE